MPYYIYRVTQIGPIRQLEKLTQLEAFMADLEAAFAATKLPERPDYARANDFLVRARRSAVT